MAGVQGLWIGRLADVDMTLRSEAARSGKKKPQLITVGVLILVEAAGVEPASVSPLPLALHA